jgi:hypothetical protein
MQRSGKLGEVPIKWAHYADPPGTLFAADPLLYLDLLRHASGIAFAGAQEANQHLIEHDMGPYTAAHDRFMAYSRAWIATLFLRDTYHAATPQEENQVVLEYSSPLIGGAGPDDYDALVEAMFG